LGLVWWHKLIIPALERLRQEDLEFGANLGYKERPGLKNKTKQQNYIEILLDIRTYCQALVAQTCNPSYSGAEIRRIAVQSQPGQIVCKTLS
jgi:hypothetical protein